MTREARLDVAAQIVLLAHKLLRDLARDETSDRWHLAAARDLWAKARWTQKMLQK